MENKLEKDKIETQTLIYRCPRRERIETRAKIEAERKYCQCVFIEGIGKMWKNLRDIQEVKVTGRNDSLELKWVEKRGQGGLKTF